MQVSRLVSVLALSAGLGLAAVGTVLAQAPARPAAPTPAAPPAAPAAAGSGSATLDAIRARGVLVCGVNTGLAGFGAPNAQGVYSGFDVDLCRGLAAAIFNDPGKVRYVGTTTQNRFTALQSGEVDVLSRNTTWSLSRDTSLGFDFPAVTFYDGQGFMVRANAGVTSARQLDGATICVQPGTTTEQNLTDWARSNHINFSPVVIDKLEEVLAAYLSGRCDAFTTDLSGLAAVRGAQPTPADHLILPEAISKEPLGPAVRQGDARWADIVRWTHYAMVAAEELGVTTANLDGMMTDPRPEVQRLVGRTGDLGAMLGLDNAWAARIIRAVGNYGEVFDRNLAPLGLQRGQNAQWNHGGLQYAPPFR